jgi:hypothetical protein
MAGYFGAGPFRQLAEPHGPQSKPQGPQPASPTPKAASNATTATLLTIRKPQAARIIAEAVAARDIDAELTGWRPRAPRQAYSGNTCVT